MSYPCIRVNVIIVINSVLAFFFWLNNFTKTPIYVNNQSKTNTIQNYCCLKLFLSNYLVQYFSLSIRCNVACDNIFFSIASSPY